MRYVAILGILCLGTVGTLGGCSDGTDGSTGAAGNGTSSSSSSSGMGGEGGGAGGGAGMGGAGGSGGGGMSIKVNGCDSATAQDETANATVKIMVGAGGFTFSPACIRVKKGTAVTFEGDFAAHPIVGGTTTAGAPPEPDPTSPIKQTMAGSSVTFTMDSAGTYPYYCEYHLPTMAGAVFVE